MSCSHQRAEQNQRKAQKRFAAQLRLPTGQNSRATLHQQDQPARCDDHRGVSPDVRQMFQVSMNPSENLDEGHDQRRPKEPGNAFSLSHFDGQHAAREPDHRHGQYEKPQVKAHSHDDVELFAANASKCLSQWAEHYQTVEQ